ncbi:MAG: outer membrane lipoprotein-sorting protein [Candidatus Edwardsbacteria bacterium]|nr:outer membrane lipoprotein-sorting protein [Candidatus Edwardsbacteria bacterium]MBU1575796.1 outer membrane lipoprotein-sorting protein [Candidatus Edwardsbacteria bacterium]MBU2463987.1 outer membrane lipoprotein-sorting protein [Candidatus Edwardsbacteria bacterium]MBU2593257.1 outer membrane lipoprotein-sorting protein [Candidatus Edwardsbacteria bacterium]
MKTKIAFLAILFVSIAGLALAQSGNDLLKRIDEKLMPESYEAYRKLINIEPNGRKKEFIFYTVKKGKDKVAMLYLSPASEKGRTTLRLGDNMWLYIPNVGKPIRITSLQSITGGVFNNADIMQVDYSAEYDVEKTEKTETGYILELKAKNKAVAYDKLKMWTTKDENLKKIECYSASGMLIKTLDFKEMKNFGNGLIRPAVIETHSPLYKGYLSTMIYTQVKSRTLKDEVFTLNFMSQLEGLRK